MTHSADSIAPNIARLRKGLGMTQDRLGQRLGISQPAVCRLERGVRLPSIGALVGLAETLGVTVNDLLEATAQENTPRQDPPEEVQRTCPECARPPW